MLNQAVGIIQTFLEKVIFFFGQQLPIFLGFLRDEACEVIKNNSVDVCQAVADNSDAIKYAATGAAVVGGAYLLYRNSGKKAENHNDTQEELTNNAGNSNDKKRVVVN